MTITSMRISHFVKLPSKMGFLYTFQILKITGEIANIKFSLLSLNEDWGPWLPEV